MAVEIPTKQPDGETAPDAGGGAVGSAEGGVNRRAHRRLRAEEVGDLATARLASGAEIKLIDLSRGGAQFESDRRFLPNSTVSLRLVTHDSTFVVHGRVVRSRIVRLDSGGLGYNVAVAFNELLQHVIDDSAVVSPEPQKAAPPAPSAADAAESVESVSAEDQAEALVLEPTAPEPESDVTPEECAAFEATVAHAPTMLTVTAQVNQSDEELLDLFNGNDW